MPQIDMEWLKMVRFWKGGAGARLQAVRMRERRRADGRGAARAAPGRSRLAGRASGGQEEGGSSGGAALDNASPKGVEERQKHGFRPDSWHHSTGACPDGMAGRPAATARRAGRAAGWLRCGTTRTPSESGAASLPAGRSWRVVGCPGLSGG